MARWSFQFNLPRKVVHFKCRVPNHKNHLVCLTGSGEELGNWNPREAVMLTYDEGIQLWSRKVSLKSPEMYRYRYFVCRLLWEDEQNRTSTIQSLKEAAGIVILFWESNIVSRIIHTRVLPEFYELPVVDFAVRAYHYTEWTRGWVYNGREIRLRLSGKQAIQFFSDSKLIGNIRIKCVPLNFQEMNKINTVPAKLGCSKQLMPVLSRFLNACDMPVCYFDPSICDTSGFSDHNCKLSRTYSVHDVVVSKLDGLHYVPGLQESKGISYTRDDLICFTISTSLNAALGFR
ncbi:hypothetical protein Btru_005386 [Bulinus truncatus]|nr:hypothetical protein Btru_005386 [Bulinus truncatus]